MKFCVWWNNDAVSEGESDMDYWRSFTDFKDERHSDSRVEVDVTMEEPPTGIVGDESNDGVTAVRNPDGVFPVEDEEKTWKKKGRES